MLSKDDIDDRNSQVLVAVLGSLIIEKEMTTVNDVEKMFHHHYLLSMMNEYF